MVTKRVIIAILIIVPLEQACLGLIKTVAAYHAMSDPEHTFPAKLGRAAIGTL